MRSVVERSRATWLAGTGVAIGVGPPPDPPCGPDAGDDKDGNEIPTTIRVETSARAHIAAAVLGRRSTVKYRPAPANENTMPPRLAVAIVAASSTHQTVHARSFRPRRSAVSQGSTSRLAPTSHVAKNSGAENDPSWRDIPNLMSAE